MFARVSKCGLQNTFGFEKTLVALMVTWIDDVASGVSIALSVFSRTKQRRKKSHASFSFDHKTSPNLRLQRTLDSTGDGVR
jgi:hypothetical protein